MCQGSGGWTNAVIIVSEPTKGEEVGLCGGAEDHLDQYTPGPVQTWTRWKSERRSGIDKHKHTDIIDLTNVL